MDAKRRENLLGHVSSMAPAFLSGYRRCFGKWPYVVPDKGGIVEGGVVFGLSDEDLARLDEYEDYSKNPEQDFYCRQRLDVRLENGHIVEAWIYIPVLDNWDAVWLEGKA